MSYHHHHHHWSLGVCFYVRAAMPWPLVYKNANELVTFNRTVGCLHRRRRWWSYCLIQIALIAAVLSCPDLYLISPPFQQLFFTLPTRCTLLLFSSIANPMRCHFTWCEESVVAQQLYHRKLVHFRFFLVVTVVTHWIHIRTDTILTIQAFAFNPL